MEIGTFDENLISAWLITSKTPKTHGSCSCGILALGSWGSAVDTNFMLNLFRKTDERNLVVLPAELCSEKDKAEEEGHLCLRSCISSITAWMCWTLSCCSPAGLSVSSRDHDGWLHICSSSSAPFWRREVRPASARGGDTECHGGTLLHPSLNNVSLLGSKKMYMLN